MGSAQFLFMKSLNIVCRLLEKHCRTLYIYTIYNYRTEKNNLMKKAIMILVEYDTLAVLESTVDGISGKDR